ncbi:Endo/excinuclease amino terminal protein [candidate division SR1 bacterium RAAC1_SR1_1]|nr:Endo/excinuclease amino terminal protein [candidate division SR1 bacterium RAAC1_SR1_1]
MRFVYIVRCIDGSLYTGISTDVEQRVNNHNTAKTGAKYTKSRRPVTLIRHKKVRNRNEASKLELQIKKMPKQKKEELVLKAPKRKQ